MKSYTHLLSQLPLGAVGRLLEGEQEHQREQTQYESQIKDHQEEQERKSDEKRPEESLDQFRIKISLRESENLNHLAPQTNEEHQFRALLNRHGQRTPKRQVEVDQQEADHSGLLLDRPSPEHQNNSQASDQSTKMRSYSHSASLSYSPVSEVSSFEGSDSGSMLICGSLSPPSAGIAGQLHTPPLNRLLESPVRQPASLQEPLERPRRLSRSEHRQSLSDLGYGKIESYFKLQRLGKGTYATVYMGRSRLSNDLVALKEILKEHDEGAPCTAIREVSLLRLLRHNNIVTLHDICHTPKKLTLVFEYVGPDLYAYMKENNNLLSIHNVRVSCSLSTRHPFAYFFSILVIIVARARGAPATAEPFVLVGVFQLASRD